MMTKYSFRLEERIVDEVEFNREFYAPYIFPSVCAPDMNKAILVITDHTTFPTSFDVLR
jgi:hypothetical protein